MTVRAEHARQNLVPWEACLRATEACRRRLKGSMGGAATGETQSRLQSHNKALHEALHEAAS